LAKMPRRNEPRTLRPRPILYNEGGFQPQGAHPHETAMYAAFFRGSRRAILLRAALLIAAIAVLDWRVVGAIPLGFLYLLPMAMVGSVLETWQIALVAVVCTVLAELFDDLAWIQPAGISRDVLYFAAFFGAGIFVREVTRNRRVVEKHVEEIERQSEARREAEEQLRVLVESSPAAILIAEAGGSVLMANEAAHRMFAAAPGALCGKSIHSWLPSLRNISVPEVSRQFFRTVMQAHGRRDNGETFLADICFSTYRTGAGLRLAVMVLDASEDLRTQEVSGLHQLLAASRIAIGAVSHEIRNICGAVGAVHLNLSREGALAGNRDFEALGNLIAAMERIASTSLRQTTSEASETDPEALLDELKIVISPMLEEEDIVLEWQVEQDLPLVWADRPSLMQVFLNLVTNSMRVLSGRDDGRVSLRARQHGGQVLVEMSDNGGGVAHPQHLFQPFQNGARSSGLGLYLSRAFLRSFGGEIRYQPLNGGASFIVTLNVAAEEVR
jgi:two-component system, LuxR family, sensor kinase FixL